MNFFNWVGSLFSPVTKLIDEVVTSDEERLTLRNELANIEKEVQLKIIELEQSRLDALSKVEVAEAASTHWLRANWRPLSSLVMVGTIMYLVFTKQPIPPEISSLAEVFLGAYTGGRSIEKVASILKKG
jgi:hypothetical protein